MMEQGFVTWGMLASYATLVSIVYLVVEFTKEIKWLKSFKTKYYSSIIAFVLILLFNLHGGTFEIWDIVLYLLSAVMISLTGNGLSDFTNPVDKDTRE